MSYHPISIGKLSPTQISKILNSHPVRIKGGSVHQISVSTEQLKKFAKAHNLGKSYTISLDPFQIQNHQHLRGGNSLHMSMEGGKTGTDFGHILGQVAGKAAQDAGTRLTSAIDGSDPSDAQYGSGFKYKKMFGRGGPPPTAYPPNAKIPLRFRGGLVQAYSPVTFPATAPRLRGGKTGTDFGHILGQVAGKAAQDAGTRLTSAIDGSDPSDAQYGSGVNRLKKGKRWLGFVQKNLGGQQVQDAIMDTASNYIRMMGGNVNRLHKAKRWTGFVQKDLGGQKVQDALMDTAANSIRFLGFGLKKRVVKRKPKQISGRALFNA